MKITEKRLWITLALVVGAGFTLLGFGGREIYRQAPPIPERIVSDSGVEIATRAQILDGQQVWQGIGGQQIGSIWGHGGYQAPDWSADRLHREALALLDVWSRAEHGIAFEALESEARGTLEARLKREMRANRYDEANGCSPSATRAGKRSSTLRRSTTRFSAATRHWPSCASRTRCTTTPWKSARTSRR